MWASLFPKVKTQTLPAPRRIFVFQHRFLTSKTDDTLGQIILLAKVRLNQLTAIVGSELSLNLEVNNLDISFDCLAGRFSVIGFEPIDRMYANIRAVQL